MTPDVARIVEYRDIRPSGAVVASWQGPEGTTYEYHPGFLPSPPLERQRREPGGEWATVATFREDGSVESMQPDGTVIISRTWRE